MDDLLVQQRIFERFLKANDPDGRISVQEINKIEISFNPVEAFLKEFQEFEKLKGISVNVLKRTEIREYPGRYCLTGHTTTPYRSENYRILSQLISTNKKIVFLVGAGVDYGINTLHEIRYALRRDDPKDVAVEWVRQFIYSRPSPAVETISKLVDKDPHISLITSNISNHFKIAGCPKERTFYWVENGLEVIGGDTVRIIMMLDIRWDEHMSFYFVEDADAMIYVGVGPRGPIMYLANAAKNAIIVYITRKDRNLKNYCPTLSKENSLECQNILGCTNVWDNVYYTKLVDRIENLFEKNKLEPSEILEKRRQFLG